MSSTVRSYGVIGILKTPVDRDTREDLWERFYDDKSQLGLNGEGTIVYLDKNAHADYSKREDFYGLQFAINDVEGKGQLILEARKYGLEVEPDTIRPYNCVWYNGGDSDMDVLTVEEFKEATEQ